MMKRKIGYMLDKTIPNWRYYGFKVGLREGQTRYIRFIIVGRSRVGSNFLRGLLNSNSHIKVFGELFQNRDEISWGIQGYPRYGPLRSRFLHDPIRFLEDDVFIPFPESISAVGFKIFYYHAQQEEWKPIWSYLIESKKLKVIHIKRRNILRTHLSRKRARITNEWVNTGIESPVNTQPIDLDYHECLADFEATRASEKQYDGYFAAHDKIEIYYEDLSADFQAEMARAQHFLGVKREQVLPDTYKQSPNSLSRAIANYNELKQRFSDTPWFEFFED